MSCRPPSRSPRRWRLGAALGVLIAVAAGTTLVASPMQVSPKGYYVLDALGGLHAGAGAGVLLPAAPYFGFPIARDLELSAACVCGKGCICTTSGYYVLDGFGGVHACGTTPPLLPATPYFEFDIAVDMELSSSTNSTGYYVLDGLGGVHTGGAANTVIQTTPYFGFPIARDYEIAYSDWRFDYVGGFVLDANGGVHAPTGAPPPQQTWLGPTSPPIGEGKIQFTVDSQEITWLHYYFDHPGPGCYEFSEITEAGIPIQPDGSFSVTFTDDGNTVTVNGTLTSPTDASGTVEYTFPPYPGCHRAGLDTWTATVVGGPTPFFGFDVARDFEFRNDFAMNGHYVLDGFGGVHAGGAAPVLLPAAPYFGFDVARDLEIWRDGYYVLDGFGGVHVGGNAPVLAPATPYFGFDVAVDAEFVVY